MVLKVIPEWYSGCVKLPKAAFEAKIKIGLMLLEITIL